MCELSFPVYRIECGIRSPACTCIISRRRAFVTPFYLRACFSARKIRIGVQFRSGRPGPRECKLWARPPTGKLVLTEFHAERTKERTVDQFYRRQWSALYVSRECTALKRGFRSTHQPRAESQSLAEWPIVSRTKKRRQPIMVYYMYSQSEYLYDCILFSLSLFPSPSRFR